MYTISFLHNDMKWNYRTETASFVTEQGQEDGPYTKFFYASDAVGICDNIVERMRERKSPEVDIQKLFIARVI